MTKQQFDGLVPVTHLAVFPVRTGVLSSLKITFDHFPFPNVRCKYFLRYYSLCFRLALMILKELQL